MYKRSLCFRSEWYRVRVVGEGGGWWVRYLWWTKKEIDTVLTMVDNIGGRRIFSFVPCHSGKHPPMLRARAVLTLYAQQSPNGVRYPARVIFVIVRRTWNVSSPVTQQQPRALMLPCGSMFSSFVSFRRSFSPLNPQGENCQACDGRPSRRRLVYLVLILVYLVIVLSGDGSLTCRLVLI